MRMNLNEALRPADGRVLGVMFSLIGIMLCFLIVLIAHHVHVSISISQTIASMANAADSASGVPLERLELLSEEAMHVRRFMAGLLQLLLITSVLSFVMYSKWSAGNDF